jgi:hypothetical protein
VIYSSAINSLLKRKKGDEIDKYESAFRWDVRWMEDTIMGKLKVVISQQLSHQTVSEGRRIVSGWRSIFYPTT